MDRKMEFVPIVPCSSEKGWILESCTCIYIQPIYVDYNPRTLNGEEMNG